MGVCIFFTIFAGNLYPGVNLNDNIDNFYAGYVNDNRDNIIDKKDNSKIIDVKCHLSCLGCLVHYPEQVDMGYDKNQNYPKLIQNSAGCV